MLGETHNLSIETIREKIAEFHGPVSTKILMTDTRSMAREQLSCDFRDSVKKGIRALCDAARLIIDNHLLSPDPLQEERGRECQQAIEALKKQYENNYQLDSFVITSKEAKKIRGSFLGELSQLLMSHQIEGCKKLHEVADLLDAVTFIVLWQRGSQSVMSVVPVDIEMAKAKYLVILDEPVEGRFTRIQIKNILTIFSEAKKNQPKWFLEKSDLEQVIIKKCVENKLFNEFLCISSGTSIPTWQRKASPAELQRIRAIAVGSRQLVEEIQLSLQQEELPDFVFNACNSVFKTAPSYLMMPGLRHWYKHSCFVLDESGNIMLDSSRYRGGIPVPYKITNESERLALTEENLKQFMHCSVELTERFAHRYAFTASEIKVLVLWVTLLSPSLLKKSNIMMIKFLEKALNALSKQECVTNGFPIAGGRHVKPAFFAPNHCIYLVGDSKTDGKDTFLNPFVSKRYDKIADFALQLLHLTGYTLSYMWPWIVRYGLNAAPDQRVDALQHYVARQLMQEEYLPIPPSVLKSIYQHLDEAINCVDQHYEINDRQTRDFRLLLMTVKSYLDILHDEEIQDVKEFGFYLSALEQILTEKIGGLVGGSCQNGNDRRGSDLMYTDAMLVYYAVYGKLPSFKNAEKKAVFWDIAAEIFCARHNPKVVGNANPWADGMKYLELTFPPEWINAIGKKMHQKQSLGESAGDISSDETRRRGLSVLAENHASATLNSVRYLRPKK